ncbi:MAG: diguanylate cyclase [Planctomycetes bacterium]|jgi:diguanylate cyclase (GGDEF)-like protein/PAS domain S-box-containing protein|nr:diguanylate cyclase [Planctomycetota bacterium]MCL4730952.1 diguanylate cyclase [Planctomycetota bacterium]
MNPDETTVRPKRHPPADLPPEKSTRTLDIGGPPAKRIFDQVSIVAVVLDTNMRIVRFNRAAERLFGKAYHEVLGRPYDEVLEIFGRVNRDHIIQRTIALGTPNEAREVEIVDPEDGESYFFDFTVDPVLGDDGKLAGVSVIGLDSTERTLLRRKLADQNRDLLALQRVSNALRKTMDLERAALIIASALTSGESGGYAQAMIFLVDEHRETLQGTVCVDSLGVSDPRGIWRGLTSNDGSVSQSLEKTQPVLARRWGELTEKVRRIKVPLSAEHSVLAHAVRTGETVTHDTLRDQPHLRVHESVLAQFPLKHFAAAPMLADREAIGLIVVDAGPKTMRFSPEQLTMLEMFASQAALAINNALKYQNMVDRAQRDSLTRLYNHGHFQEVLKTEIDRAERYGNQISLVLLDIDHFKKFNDVYGHQTGDKVLRQTALLLNSLVRVSDVAARYGGEEFAVLLPQTPYQAARETAERLRDGVARKATVTGPKGEKLNVTASFGVATFPDHAQSASELVALADEALYLAKERGRNRVCGADQLPEPGEDSTEPPRPNKPRRTSDILRHVKSTPVTPPTRRKSGKVPRKSGKLR